MRKYLEPYRTEHGYDLFRLIHDDHLRGPQLLWNSGLRIPAVKLLLSTIDTLAFVVYGDKAKNFHDWVEAYLDLPRLKVTADELWEFRNSLLHMNNNTSRKVSAGKTRPIIPYFGGGPLPEEYSGDSPIAVLMNGDDFVAQTLNAIEAFCESVKSDKEKLERIFSAYDNIFSDSRYLDISEGSFQEIHL